jgi:hypothetical protein
VLLAWPDITINSLIWQWLRNPSNHQLTNKTQVSINKPPFSTESGLTKGRFCR